MHTQYLKIEDLEIRKVLSAKQKSEKTRKVEYIERLKSLSQFHLNSNLDMECSIVFYNPCTIIWVTCTI
jgi:hypothetical protein